MSKINLIVDITKCNNCNNCTMAMKDEYVGNDFKGYSAAQPKEGHSWITIDRHTRGHGPMVDVNYLPRTCNHCDNAPCVAAGQGAVTKRLDGIVMIDPVKAKGRKDLVASCPYGAIWWNEELQLPQQWTFDAHLLDAGWKQPRIVQACATGALRSVKASDAEMQTIAKAENLAVLKAELNTQPRVYYRGLERLNTSFLGGNVSVRGKDGLLDNVEAASVELVIGNEQTSIQVKTDHFGDFKIDCLTGQGESFEVIVSHPNWGDGNVTGTLQGSVYLGSIELQS